METYSSENIQFGGMLLSWMNKVGNAKMKSKRQAPAHVLIVDDDSGFTIRTSMILRNAGYEVSVAENGEEALELLLGESRMPTLILLDLVMPAMDGWRFREIQKNHSKLWHLPVVVVSDAPVNEEYASLLEAAAVLVKPFDRGELLRTLSRVLSSIQFRRSEAPERRPSHEADF